MQRIEQPEEYDPLDYDNLARSCVQRLLQQRPLTLPLTWQFRGAGVYALFYDGDFAPYAPIRSPDATRPIYVGKAEPAGMRQGGTTGEAALGHELFNRIAKHTRSIRSVENLRIEDFRCRYLVVVPLWIRMVERFLIEGREFGRPIWNACLPGLGLNDPGAGRSPTVSWWDAMHPDRPAALGWRANIQRTRTVSDAERQLADCIRSPTLHPAEMERDD